jgi:hypothetical protein
MFLLVKRIIVQNTRQNQVHLVRLQSTLFSEECILQLKVAGMFQNYSYPHMVFVSLIIVYALLKMEYSFSQESDL